MKILAANSGSQRGNVLLVALGMGIVIGTTMLAYMSMVNQQNQSIARSQAWNSAIPVAEAGIEEALTQVFYCGTTNLTANGWTLAGGVYTKSRTGVLGGAYSVTVSNDVPPTIYSTGYTTNYPSGSAVSRTVKVTTFGGFLFAKGLVAKGNIAVGQGNVDSYDSGGLFTFLRGFTFLRSNGDTTSINGLISLGANGDIAGHVSYRPGDLSSSGTIGPIGTPSGTTAAGYASPTASGSITDVVLPAGLATATTVNLSGTYTFNTSGTYQCNGMSGTITVASGANVTLYCTGNAAFSGQNGINVSSNASLTVYLDGGTFTATGNSFVNSGPAKDFQLYGTPNCTTITVGGNGTFCGTIYAPEAALTLDGSGTSGVFAGAAVVNTATFNGNNANFNYDEDLGRHGPHATYLVGDWREL